MNLDHIGKNSWSMKLYEGTNERKKRRTVNWSLLSVSESLSVSISTDALFLLLPALLSCPDTLPSSSCSSELLPASAAGDEDCEEEAFTLSSWYFYLKVLILNDECSVTFPLDDKDSSFCKAEFRFSSTTTVKETWQREVLFITCAR